MTKDELLKLADRVEALTGDDTSMMFEAFDAVKPRTLPARAGIVHHNPEFIRFDKLICAGASLDAAMTLVPEEWEWMVGHGRKPMAYVHNGESAFSGVATRPNPKRRWFELSAATPALALTAACLRAHAAFLGN